RTHAARAAAALAAAAAGRTGVHAARARAGGLPAWNGALERAVGLELIRVRAHAVDADLVLDVAVAIRVTLVTALQVHRADERVVTVRVVLALRLFLELAELRRLTRVAFRVHGDAALVRGAVPDLGAFGVTEPEATDEAGGALAVELASLHLIAGRIV